ncbi:MAG: hypothetical protein A2103_04935 [Gammaproteobacteria bacterium GWF2_41_13]|nr:MAG: hypothetical protein A2103_04935 [Gammaproteobacteria bacterium GWF2_41_13]
MSISPKKQIAIEALNWSQARSYLHGLNDELANIIDELNPSKRYTIYKARYPYGSEILKNFIFQFPSHDGQFISIDDPRIPSALREDLGYNYNTNPAGILLNKAIEIYVEVEHRIVPFSVVYPGGVFGLWKILDIPPISHCPPQFCWGMTAGARSIFMLPQISEANAHSKLRKEFHINADKPRGFQDHQHVFTEIANSSIFPSPWSLDVLFFSKAWFEKIHTMDKAWLKFNHYMFQRGWHSSEFWRNSFIWDLTFTRIQSYRHLKPTPYISDIVKHLFTIGVGALPGFAPAMNDELAPISGLQQVYLDCYQLKNRYAPSIIVPAYFNAQKGVSPVYYSLQYPTAMELSPKTNRRQGVTNDLFAIKSLLNNYLLELSQHRLHLESTPIDEISKSLRFRYYHADVGEGKYSEIHNSRLLIKEDPRFSKALCDQKEKIAAINSLFFKGCVQLSVK